MTLTWNAVPGATGYTVYRDGKPVTQTAGGVTTLVSGATPITGTIAATR